MNFRVMLNALRTHKFQTRSFSTEISYWLVKMFVTRNVVCIVCFHILQSECFVHGSYQEYSKYIIIKDKLTNRSFSWLSCLCWLVSCFLLLLSSISSCCTSASSSLTFRSVTISVFSSDSLSSVLDQMLILSFLIFSEWIDNYFQVRGTTSSVRLRYSERNFLPSLLMKQQKCCQLKTSSTNPLSLSDLMIFLR